MEHGGRKARPCGRDEIGDEPHFVPVALERRNHRLAHLWHAEQGRLYLDRLDAVAPHLQCEVHASQILETLVGTHPSHVAGSIDTKLPGLLQGRVERPPP